MITVAIYINQLPVRLVTAVNQGLANSSSLHEDTCIYKMDDGTTVLHRRSDGAEELAIKILKAVKKKCPTP